MHLCRGSGNQPLCVALPVLFVEVKHRVVRKLQFALGINGGNSTYAVGVYVFKHLYALNIPVCVHG